MTDLTNDIEYPQPKRANKEHLEDAVSMDEFFKKLKSATPFVPIPEKLNGLREVADFSESVEHKFSHVFWNTPNRISMTDAAYIGMVISVLKKRIGKEGILKALEIIKMIEVNNA